MAVKFAGWTVLELFRAYVRPRKDPKAQAGEVLTDKSATVAAPPLKRRCEVLYTKHDLYQTDQVYSPIL